MYTGLIHLCSVRVKLVLHDEQRYKVWQMWVFFLCIVSLMSHSLPFILSDVEKCTAYCMCMHCIPNYNSFVPSSIVTEAEEESDCCKLFQAW